MIKGSIHQEDRAILNVYASKQQSWKIREAKLIELKGEIDKSTVTLQTLASLSQQLIGQLDRKSSR